MSNDIEVWDAAPAEVQNAVSAAAVFHAQKSAADDGIKAALVAGHVLGHHLGEVRNKYADAFEAVLAKAQVSRPLADRLMRFSKETTLEDIEAGRTRQGMLELQFVPPADKKAPAEDRRMDALPHISSMVLHWRRVSRLMELGQLKVDKEQIKEKTKDLYAWLLEIHADQE